MAGIAHRRRSIRLKDYDYAQSGAYFVTICAQTHAPIFGSIAMDEMVLNECGHIAFEEWEQTQVLRPNIELDAFVIMPNHIHGIVIITGDSGNERMMHHVPTTTQARQFSTPIADSLSTIVATFKAAVTRRINRTKQFPLAVWQRNFYEHVIRNESDLNRIRAYIENNPGRWAEDSLYVPPRVENE